MLFAKQPELPIMVCPSCAGGGYRGVVRCRECRGMGMGVMDHDIFLYFGEPLTPYHIAVRRARRVLDKARIMGAMIVAILSWGLFAYYVYENRWLEQLLTSRFWLTTIAPGKSFFWFGIASFSYLLYRVIVLQKPQLEIPHESYEKSKTASAEEGPGTQSSWVELKKRGKKKRIDIADRFTPSARQALEDAFALADKNHQPSITPEHLFSTLLSSSDIAGIFIRLGIPPDALKKKLAGATLGTPGAGRPAISPAVQQIIFSAYETARRFKDTNVRVTELLVGTVNQSEKLQEVLYDLNIDTQKLTNVIEWVRVREHLRGQYKNLRRAAAHRSKYGLDRAMTAVATPYLNNFSQDITLAAKFGYLEPCVARDLEIDEVFRIIEGGQQSVLLVGDQGVGKMTIIEGIAQRMVEEDVPVRLRDKRLVQLSTSALLAGTTVSGAQERLLKIMHEVGRAKNIILFIKNLHDLMGMTDAQGGGLDVSETLAEYLGPRKYLAFATTTKEGYNRHVLNSQAGQVFAPVEIKEMDTNQAIQALESKIGGVEYKQQVFFSYDALESCVKMATRFLHDQRLPESAIALMGEAASYVRNQRGLNQLVGGNDVGAVVGQKTGIPVTSITEGESEKLLRLEEEMHKRVVGQDEAVSLVANALRRSRAEIRSQKRPIATFLFLGPTGVGKTELAKTIAAVYFGGEQRMVRVDMSEYQDTGSLYRLIGQTGQQGTGLLTEAVRQNPFSLVLLDELEKADPNVLNLFLQVFDDGRLTDSVGHVIDFTNTIIIATSNAGTPYVQAEIQKGTALDTIREQLIRSELKTYYHPEFLNRFDGIVLFKPLGKDEIKRIAGLMLGRVAKDLAQRGVELRVEDVALDVLSEAGFDPEFGARPMARAIQERVENQLAELVLQGKLQRRDVVVLGQNAEIRVEHA